MTDTFEPIRDYTERRLFEVLDEETNLKKQLANLIEEKKTLIRAAKAMGIIERNKYDGIGNAVNNNIINLLSEHGPMKRSKLKDKLLEIFGKNFRINGLDICLIRGKKSGVFVHDKQNSLWSLTNKPEDTLY